MYPIKRLFNIKNLSTVLFITSLASCGGGGGSSNESTSSTSSLISTTAEFDTTFGIQGKVVHDNAAGGNGHDYGNTLTIDASGRIIVAGYSASASNGRDIAVWRYTSTGELDTTFATGGVFTIDNLAGGNSYDSASDIILDSSGRILITGTSDTVGNDSDIYILRLTANGILDTTFGSNGYVVYGGSDFDTSNAITLDANENILITGSLPFGININMAILRFTPTGVLDTSFGTGGIVEHEGAGYISGGNSISFDNNGKILVAGYTTDEATPDADMCLWRFNSNGTIDNTFGIDYDLSTQPDGYIALNNSLGGNNHDVAYDFKIDSQGRIIAVGESTLSGSSPLMSLWRFSNNGTLDTSFNTTGYVSYTGAAGGEHDVASALVLDSKDNIYIAGSSWNGSIDSYLTLWSYDSNGEPNLSLSADNKNVFINSAPIGGNVATAITMDASGNLFITGTSDDATLDMALWKIRLN